VRLYPEERPGLVALVDGTDLDDGGLADLLASPAR
jgi:hypothetical protein